VLELGLGLGLGFGFGLGLELGLGLGLAHLGAPLLQVTSVCGARRGALGAQRA